MREIADQHLEWHAMLQCHRNHGAERFHQAGQVDPALAMRMKISPGLPLGQSDGEIAFVSCDREVVSDGGTLVR